MMKFIRGKSASNPPTPSKRDLQKRNSVDLHNKPCALAYDPKLNLLAIGNRNGAIKIYGKQGIEMQASFDSSEQSIRINQLLFVEGTGRLICLCEDSSLHLWEIRDHPPLPPPPPPPRTSKTTPSVEPQKLETKSTECKSIEKSTSIAQPQASNCSNQTNQSNVSNQPNHVKSSSISAPTRTRRLIRTKTCTYFCKSLAGTLADSLSKSQSLDSAISLSSSVSSEQEATKEKSKLNAVKLTAEVDKSKTIETKVEQTESIGEVKETEVDTLKTMQANKTAETNNNQDEDSLQSTSVASSNNSSFPDQNFSKPLPFALQRRLCNWSNEIVSFTLNGSYATIVTRLGELFVMDVHKFELLPQQTVAINAQQWHLQQQQLKQVQSQPEQPNEQRQPQTEQNASNQLTTRMSLVEQRLRLLAQQARFCNSDLNLNSSCNDSVISCSNSTASTFSSLESDDASVADFERLSPSIDTTDCTLRSSTRSAILSRLPTNRNSFDSKSQANLKIASKLHMIKVYTSILCNEVEYKTLSISNDTTSKQLICLLLNKLKMKHRDPNLFYMTMEISIKKSGVAVKNVMVLNDESCPIQLKSCYPHDDTKFCLMSRNGGLVKVYDSCLMTGSLYKSVFLSESTNTRELIQLILHCYNSTECPTEFKLYEVSKTKSVLLNDHELPLKRQLQWTDTENMFFQLRRSKDIIPIAKPSRKSQCAARQIECSTPVISMPRDYENYFYI